eukprot:gnl/Ergobibamus_cyprinoides/5128.p1 GENE.gnl/Ergobibamus_cyprinoides/5128~~gnl/Ergobibamus_cyprinoides/5128.p1  ORF type:complete len:183 (+),score=68.98 gnl/Ergobibamus_cyprinoides/5128:79-549(+)
MTLRVCSENPDLEVVAVNDPFIAPDYMVYQFKYDSVPRGSFKGEVAHDADHIIVNGHAIKVFNSRNPAEIDWTSCGAEIVVESTGVFTTVEAAGVHLGGSVKKVPHLRALQGRPHVRHGRERGDLRPRHHGRRLQRFLHHQRLRRHRQGPRGELGH